MHCQIISECRKQENIIAFFVGNSWQYLYILSQKFQPDKYGSTMDAKKYLWYLLCAMLILLG